MTYLSKLATGLAAVTLILATACSTTQPAAPATSAPSTSGDPAAAAIPQHSKDQTLYDQLPANVKQAGKLVSVDSGAFPPYEIPMGDGKTLQGATADLATALGQILGISIENASVDSLAGELSGIQAGRYDLALGPVGDFTDREQGHDFIDWVQEFVVFAVPQGNPKNINSLDDTCGLNIAVQSGGSAEKVIKQQSGTCTSAGKAAVNVQSYQDQPTSILSVQSGRADAFFSSQSPLSYFVQQSNGKLQLAATGQKNGFDNLFQGAVLPANSPLRQPILTAMQQLFADGTYKAIMDKWGLQGNMIDKPGVNLAAG